MTAFRWIDRAGIAHEITTCDPIEEEYRAVAREMIALRPRLESQDEAVFMSANSTAAFLTSRLTRLQADLDRWDQALSVQIRKQADEAREVIGSIIVDAKYIRTLHACYDQDKGSTQQGNNRLKGPPLAEQVLVLRERAVRENRQYREPESFSHAHAMLTTSPGTNRVPNPPGALTFEWSDRLGHVHQLRSLIPIEAEFLAIADEIIHLLPELYPEIEIRRVSIALEKIRLAVARIAVLEQNMHNYSSFMLELARKTALDNLSALETFVGRDH